MAADGSVIIEILGDDSKLKKMLGGLGNAAGTALKGMGVAVGAAGAAFGALSKAAIDSYADYEQLTGGVETLFKASSGAVMEYANNAYKTAGMSANQYMETVTSFSASLLQGLGGDTAKAAEIADKAVTDMADNANKMGTDIGSIQQAYQGFAKQNYTMLDNLKLGYGGTQAEMARLINDSGVLGDTIEVTASTVNGVSFDKIIEAIHVTQERMGIAGATAEEASSTIQGSIASMGAAWSNFLTGMADENSDFDALLGNLVDSVLTVAENLIPRIQILLPRLAEGLSELIEKLGPELPALIEGLLPPLLEGGVALINGVLAALPALVSTLGNALPGILATLVEGLVAVLPQFVDAAAQMIAALATGIGEALPTLIPAAVQAVVALVEGLIANIPLLVSGAAQLVTGLAEGIMAALPALVEAVPVLIGGLVDALLGSLPIIIETGIELFTALVGALPEIITQIGAAIPEIVDGISKGLQEAIPQIIDAGIMLFTALVDNLPAIIQAIVAVLPEIVSSIVGAIVDNLPLIIEAGVKLFVALVENLPAIIAEIVKAVPEIVKAIVDGFASLGDSIVQIGADIVSGIWDGIQSMAGWIKEKVEGFFTGIVDGVKDLLGIHSPSRVFSDIGKNTAKGYGDGFTDQSAKEQSAIRDAMNDMVDSAAMDKDLSDAGALAGKTFSAGMQDELNDLSAKMQAAVAVEAHETGLRMAGGAVASNPGLDKDEPERRGEGEAGRPTVIRFTGDLAQLGRVLKPVIDDEDNRTGPDLVEV